MIDQSSARLQHTQACQELSHDPSHAVPWRLALLGLALDGLRRNRQARTNVPVTSSLQIQILKLRLMAAYQTQVGRNCLDKTNIYIYIYMYIYIQVRSVYTDMYV